MINWADSMQQSFEYYVVDPGTWKDVRLLTSVKSSTITRDNDSETRGSASIEIMDSLGECYIRIYLVAIQNGIKERIPLGTFIGQTPSSNFDGKARAVTMDAYTPLLELKENPPPIGYSLRKGDNIMETAYRLCREHARAPSIYTQCLDILSSDFIANTSDTWLTFISDLTAVANYSLDLDEYGHILFSPKQDVASLRPVWTYTDDNSSILYPELSLEHDLYGIPNVVEVVYSTPTQTYQARVVNDDPNSLTSTVNRGREILYRDTSPTLPAGLALHQVHEYATQLLKTLSTVESTVSYTHAYCPTRVNDCVLLNYSKADLINVKAKIVSQSISCTPGCPVSEKAVFTRKLWG